MGKISSVAFAFMFFGLPVAYPQTASQPVTSNPQAVSLANQALAALVGATQVSDITLTGTATRTAGSDVETGNITLRALGYGNARLDLSSSSGTRSEVRNIANGPGGFWVGPGGVSHTMAYHNCMTDAAWFFPALSVLSQLSNPDFVVTYVGPETRAGVNVYHIQIWMEVTSDTSGILLRLSTEDVYLSASSYLPVALVFNTHPDDDALTNIRSEVDFSNYQQVNGVEIPFRIQMLLNGGLFLDTTVESVVLNSGLPQSDFTAQ